jgi:aminoglycoside phosphotransferase (APT) family kinase protein
MTQFSIDASLVRRLIAAQFPQWSHLPIQPVANGGWDNRTFHLGDDLSARLPSAACYEPQVEKEHRWLPELAPQLPLPIPVPLGKGVPGEGYPFHWSVYRWLDGEPAAKGRVSDKKRLATDLAEFLVALQNIDATGGPAAGEHNFHRGGSLRVYDAETRRAAAALEEELDRDAVISVWETALATRWERPPVWVHGDVAEGNLLVKDGRLSAVIDFGSSGVGDPSSDLYIAWTFLDRESRETFRAALALDEETWQRGRGWTLWKALIVWAERRKSDTLWGWSQKVIEEILLDHKHRA